MSLSLLLLYGTATTEAKTQVFGVRRFVLGVSTDEKVTVPTAMNSCCTVEVTKVSLCTINDDQGCGSLQ